MDDRKTLTTTSSEIISLSAIPMKHRKSLCNWLGESSIFYSQQFVPGDIYEFWLDNFSSNPANMALLDF